MLNSWSFLTQDNKVKLIIIVMPVALFSVVGYFWKSRLEPAKLISPDTQATVTQTTTSDSSPAVSGTKGDVTININTPDQSKQP